MRVISRTAALGTSVSPHRDIVKIAQLPWSQPARNTGRLGISFAQDGKAIEGFIT